MLRDFRLRHLLYWRLFLLFSLVNYAVSPGVAGAAFEHLLEGEAEDPTRAGQNRRSPLTGGLDNGWGRGWSVGEASPFLYKKDESRNFFDSHLYYFGSGSFTPCGVQDDTSDYRLINPSVSLLMAS